MQIWSHIVGKIACTHVCAWATMNVYGYAIIFSLYACPMECPQTLTTNACLLSHGATFWGAILATDYVLNGAPKSCIVAEKVHVLHESLRTLHEIYMLIQ